MLGPQPKSRMSSNPSTSANALDRSEPPPGDFSPAASAMLSPTTGYQRAEFCEWGQAFGVDWFLQALWMCPTPAESCYSVGVFTGLVQAMGTLRRRSSTRTGALLVIE